MYYSLISQFLFYNEKILEKLNDPFVYIEVIKFRNHSFLILEILFIGVYQGISLIHNWSNVIENLGVESALKRD